MRVIIIGGGKTVYFLARRFTSKGYHVTIINHDSTEATALSRQMKAIVVVGDGSDPVTLAEAGARQADIVVALTAYDQDNLVACQIAQKLYGVTRAIALVNDPDNQEVFHKLGVTVAFSATQVIANLIEQRTYFKDIINLVPIAEGRVNVTEVVLRAENQAVNKSIQELELPVGNLIACIIRNEQVIVPTGETRLQMADRLILIGQSENYEQVMRILTDELA